MKELTSTQQEYLKMAELFLWAKATDFTCWLTGERKRWKRTEYTLPRLVDRGYLQARRHGKELVYTLPSNRKVYTADIEHGLMCTKILLRLKASRDGDFLAENLFRQLRFGSVPEAGVIYDDTLLIFEYSTADNVRRTRLMKQKVSQYKTAMPKFEHHFEKKVMVLFIFAASRHKVIHFAQKYADDTRFYFCDLETFVGIESGHQLRAPIYIWRDGCAYTLTSC